MTKKLMALVAALGITTCLSGSVHAVTQLVTNGNFTTITGKDGGELVTTITSANQNYATVATGWATTGYNFLFPSGTADSTGVTGSSGNLKLWGPGDGSNNGLPASSPNGGNYIADDGAYGVKPVTQTINGLTVGDSYILTFFWGAGQQTNHSGATTDQWLVSLGNQTQDTAIDSIASHGFSGWQQQTFFYKATSTSEVLSFLANGTPSGVPPFALLDGVSLVLAPEPSPFLTMFAGMLGVAAIGFFRFRTRKSAL